MKKITLAILMLFLALPLMAAGLDVNTSEGLTASGEPLALRGYDPVSYFESGGPKLGSFRHEAKHNGATYRFASRENLEKFKRAPQRYAPQFGGFCAYGVAVGQKFDGDPLLWRVVDGKLYLNLSPDIQAKWQEDFRGNIDKADRNWKKIRNQKVSDLK